MRELYLNNELVDLPEDALIALSLSINNIGELKTRQSTNSNSFVLPKTSRNKSVVENSEMMTSTTLLPYRKLTAKYVQDGVEVISRGFAILSESEKGYEFVIYSGNVSLFDAIGEKTLRELAGLSIYNHTWNLATVAGSRTNTAGYIYPIIDYGSLSETLREIDTRTMYMAVFFHTFVDLIIKEAGFGKSGDIFTDEFYLAQILPSMALPSITDATKAERAFTAYPLSQYDIGYDGTGTTYYHQLFFDDDYISGSDPGGNYDPYYSEYTFSANAEGTFKATLVFQRDNPGAFSCMFIKNAVLSNGTYGSLISGTVLNTAYGGAFISGYGSQYTVEFQADENTFAAGETVSLFISYTDDSYYGATTFTFYTGSKISFELTSDLIYGDEVDVARQMPKIKQRDFLKWVMQEFGLMIDTNDLTKKVRFFSLENISENKKSAVDWSSKVDVSRVPQLSYRLGDYGRVNNMKWKEDDTIDTEDLGNGTFSIDDETLDSEKDVVEVGFAATEMIQRLDLLDVPEIIIADKPKDRQLILLPTDLSTASPVNDLRYYDASGSVYATDSIPLCYFILDEQTRTLHFDNLIENYYSAIVRSLDRQKIVSVYLRLDATDIANFDFINPVFLDVNTPGFNLNGYFYVNKIEAWRKDKPVKVQLIRL